MKEKNPLVSLVMLAWNRKEEVLDSLKHLFQCNYDNYEIIVIDNGSTDGTAKAVKEEFPTAKLVELPNNIGIEGYNYGFDQSNGDYVIVLDDDSYIERDAIQKMVRKFSELPSEVGIVNFQVINVKTGLSATPEWPEKIITFWGCGAAIKKELINKIGGYDKELFLYRNEFEMSIRALLHGYRVVHCEDILAYHKIVPKRYANTRTFYYANRNDLYILYKYFPALAMLDHSFFIFFKTFFQSFKHKGFPFFSIWWGAFKKIVKTKRQVIKDKELLKFIYNQDNKIFLPNRFSYFMFGRFQSKIS